MTPRLSIWSFWGIAAVLVVCCSPVMMCGCAASGPKPVAEVRHAETAPSTAHTQGAGIEWEILSREVQDLYRAGKYDRAVLVALEALEVAEENAGSDHPDVATSLNNLAMLYDDQGHYAKAEPLYKRSLAIKEKALGPKHSSVAVTLSNLAGLYDDQGHYAKAEPLYKRSLAIQEKAFGPDHPDVATILENQSPPAPDLITVTKTDDSCKYPLHRPIERVRMRTAPRISGPQGCSNRPRVWTSERLMEVYMQSRAWWRPRPARCLRAVGRTSRISGGRQCMRSEKRWGVWAAGLRIKSPQTLIYLRKNP
jgi:hypothetical protein